MRSLVAMTVLMSLPVAVSAQQCVTTKPPKDAIVLVKGEDTSQWKAQNGERCPWPTKDGVMEVHAINVLTKREYGDVQLHIEFRIPERPGPPQGGFGNSGVYLHGDYELQVIDSYGWPLHYKSSCGAVYGQVAPLMDASLPPGEWQSFDVLFHAPHYDSHGKVTKKARMSVLQNGLWVQDNVELDPTPGGLTDNTKHTGPLWLQSHGYKVRYRNIWLRDLEKRPDKPETKPGTHSAAPRKVPAGASGSGDPVATGKATSPGCSVPSSRHASTQPAVES